ncbi:DUF551 domain-containing protein [Klebsiella variicola]|nr:DUF551 domain-containing protein [Klebsiella variicola]MDD9251395.1 DUF551 domain-containing protein [Klebsiella variicola]
MAKPTITRERLVKIKSWREIYGAGSNVMLPAEEAEALALIALAAMDSEPVAEVLSNRPGNDTSTIDMALPVGTQLYRHAQQLVVPDEMLCEFYEVDNWPDLVREVVKHVEQLQDSAKRNVKPWEDTFPETLLPAYIERVEQADKACRAAMLAAAPQSPGSEPATVPGKWIPVSERMPEDRTQVILWDAEIGEVTSGHYSHKTHTFYHCGDAIENEITHWMAPPAAPQEVSDAER